MYVIPHAHTHTHNCIDVLMDDTFTKMHESWMEVCSCRVQLEWKDISFWLFLGMHMNELVHWTEKKENLLCRSDPPPLDKSATHNEDTTVRANTHTHIYTLSLPCPGSHPGSSLAIASHPYTQARKKEWVEGWVVLRLNCSHSQLSFLPCTTFSLSHTQSV